MKKETKKHSIENLDKIYIQIDGQSSIYLVDDLNKFSENYRTEKDCGIS